jgi:putative tricarboxylic transport membrane protein
MNERAMARADLLTGAVLFVLAIAVIYGAWTMERLELRRIHPASVPGLTPGLLGLALAVASLVLIAGALKRRRAAMAASPASADAAVQAADSGAFTRLAMAAALCMVYALGFVGRMPFWLATWLFVTAFIAIFEWENSAAGRVRRLAWAVFLGLATGLAVSYAFRDIFLVRLP